MTKKIFPLFFSRIPITAYVLLCAVLSCGNTSATKREEAVESKSDTPVELCWLSIWKGEQSKEALLMDIKREFEFQNPGVTINLKILTRDEERDFNTKAILDAIMSGRTEWDIVVLHPPNYVSIAEALHDPGWISKYCVDFSLVPGFTASQKPFIINDPLYKEQMGGVLAGPHVEGFYWALYYNADVAGRLGLTIPSQDMSFQDLLACVKAVYEYNKKNNVRIAAFYEAQDWCTLYILFQRLFDSQIEDFREVAAPVFTERKSAALQRALQAFEELAKYQPIMEPSAQGKWSETLGYILQERALFLVNGTWMYTSWGPLDPTKLDKMIPVELPAFAKTGHYLGSYKTTWGVLKVSPHRDLAVKFLMSWSSPRVAEKWVKITKSPTGLQGNMTQPTLGDDQYEKFQFMIEKKYGGNIFYPESTGYMLGRERDNLRPLLEETLRTLLAGRISADQAYLTLMQPGAKGK